MERSGNSPSARGPSFWRAIWQLLLRISIMFISFNLLILILDLFSKKVIREAYKDLYTRMIVTALLMEVERENTNCAIIGKR